MNDYRLDVYDLTGAFRYSLTDFTSLAYTTRVNSQGLVNFTVGKLHPLLKVMEDKWQVEVWRKPSGYTWAREITGLIRKTDQQFKDKSDTALISCIGLMDVLAWRVVAWSAGTVNRSVFIGVPAETIATSLVKYNATSDATATAGRYRDGAVPGLSLATPGATGNSLDWYCAHANLLATLQNLSKVGGGDFSVLKTSPTTYEFKWYNGQLGTDRSSSVIFALERGNIIDPTYSSDQLDEATVAIVGGKGEKETRAIAVRAGPNYVVSTNDIEIFVEATDVDTVDGLNARGDKALDERKAESSFKFTVVQSPASRYGVHYFLGDLVTVVNTFNKTEAVLKASSFSVSLDSKGKETVAAEIS